MALRYYMDVHVPRRITEQLRRRGIDVVTAQQDGYADVDDESSLRRATEAKRLLVSQDHDFFEIAAQWQTNGTEFDGIVHLELEWTTLGKCVDDLELQARAEPPENCRNLIQFIPLK